MTDDIYVAGPAFDESVEPWSASDLRDELQNLSFTQQRVLAIAEEATGLELQELVDALLSIRQAKRIVAETERTLEDKLGETMSKSMIVMDGIGRLKRRKRTNRTQWDKDALLSAVLDSRLVIAETGEVVEETPLERVLSVWNLGVPRTTILHQRGIDPDQFARVEVQPGWAVEVQA